MFVFLFRVIFHLVFLFLFLFFSFFGTLRTRRKTAPSNRRRVEHQLTSLLNVFALFCIFSSLVAKETKLYILSCFICFVFFFFLIKCFWKLQLRKYIFQTLTLFEKCLFTSLHGFLSRKIFLFCSYLSTFSVFSQLKKLPPVCTFTSLNILLFFAFCPFVKIFFYILLC